MAAVYHSLDVYKVPRQSVNVEALAQELARYLQMTAEDTEVLSQDPTRRDNLIWELYKQPGVKPNCYASQFVPPGGDPDAHLVPANAEIEKLTPPKSFEERVKRLHLAFAAMMVFNQYKVGYALRDLPDLERKVERRRHELMDEWRRDVFAVRFPPRPPCLPTAPPSHYSAKRVPEDELLNFLDNPHTMVGKQFVHSPPQDQDQDQEDSDTWEVISYTAKKTDTGVEHQYQVLLQAFSEDPLPMDKEDVRDLLRYSRLFV
ncbi:hypothetical protein LXA43DRAFT_1181577 [Ganoderma leucocontextum]|nr:hypothetical protein LXA43DRAFT_1181577 [Ganoderma leucocontextum]